jgi:hypothetical protein
MEAMAAGRSVVATDFEGARVGLPTGAGQVVAHDDDGALRDAVTTRLLDPPLARGEGAVGRRFVTTSCGVSATAAAVRSLYAELAPVPA